MRVVIFILSLVLAGVETTHVYQTTQQASINYYSGKRLLDSGQLDEAARFYEKALSINPNHLDAIRDLGLIYQWTDRHEEAIKLFRKFLEQHPHDTSVKKALAETLSWTGQYPQAIEIYLELLREKPDAGLEKQLAEIYLWNSQYQEAFKLIHSLRERFPNDPYVIYLLAKADQDSGNPKEALHLYEGLLGMSGRDVQEMNERMGETYMELAQYDKAIEIYKGILAKSPKRADIRVKMADVLSWQKCYPQAIKEYQEAYNQNPALPGITKKIAQVYFWMHDLGNAERWLRKAHEQNPDDVSIVMSLAKVLESKFQYREAAQLLESAFRLDSSERMKLSYARLIHNSGDLARAQFLLEHLASVDPSSSKAKLYLADTLAARKEFRKAIKLYREVLQKRKSFKVMERLADVYSWNRQYEEAVATYDQILSFQEDAKVRLQKARVLGWSGKYREALKEYGDLIKRKPSELFTLEMEAKQANWSQKIQSAISLFQKLIHQNPSNTEALFDVGQIYSYQKMWREAIDSYDKILRQSPNHFKAREARKKAKLIREGLLIQGGYEFFEADSSAPDGHSEAQRSQFV